MLVFYPLMCKSVTTRRMQDPIRNNPADYIIPNLAKYLIPISQWMTML